MISRRHLLQVAAVSPLAARTATAAQRSTPLVAFLGADSPATTQHFLDAFRQGMREHGYVDKRNVTIEERWAEGRIERFPGLKSSAASGSSY